MSVTHVTLTLLTPSTLQDRSRLLPPRYRFTHHCSAAKHPVSYQSCPSQQHRSGSSSGPFPHTHRILMGFRQTAVRALSGPLPLPCCVHVTCDKRLVPSSLLLNQHVYGVSVMAGLKTSEQQTPAKKLHRIDVTAQQQQKLNTV